MNVQTSILHYTINDIIAYRSINWPESKDFLFLTDIPIKFEQDFVKPDYYCFGMITEGLLEININSNIYNLSPNSLLIYRPGELWKVCKLAPGTRGSFVLFHKKFLDSLNETIFSVKSSSFLSQGIQSNIELSDQDLEKISGLFGGIFTMLHHLSKSNWELVARNLVSALIYETDTILSGYIHDDHIPSTKEEELYSRFRHLMTIHFKTNRKPNFYASQLCVTPNYLHAVIKKLSGQTPTELINKQVISEAGYRISYTLASFAQIANDLNFCDPFTFSKYFKKNAGCSPTHYRKRTVTSIGIHEN